MFSFFKKKLGISNKTFGAIGEDIAEDFLKSSGYIILAKNYRCRSGEIDIIAKIGDIIAFIEVKTRSSSYFGTPEEAVTPVKQKHICRVAKYYISKNDFDDFSFRADIISVMYSSDTPQISHTIDAFPLSQ